MPSTWTKISDKPQDRGLYRNEGGTIRVMYQEVELKGGRKQAVQRSRTFPKSGNYRITLPEGTSKRVSALVFARDFKAQKDREPKAGKVHDVAREEMTLSQYFLRWIERPSGRTGVRRRPSTLARVDASWRVHISPHFGDMPIQAITRSDVLDWHAALKAGPAAKNKAVRTLRALLASAESEGLRNDNPATGLKATDRVRAIEALEVFTPEQVSKLREGLARTVPTDD